MARDEESPVANVGVSTAQGLLDSIFGNLKDLKTGNGTSNLFPNGIRSVDLEVILRAEEKKEFRMALKIVGSSSNSVTSSATWSEEDGTGTTFNARGHNIIALIATQDLVTNSPEAMRRVQQILDSGDRTVKEAATFPDVIRNQHPETKPFHYIDIPFEDGGEENPPLPDAPHALSKIGEFTDFLRGGGGDDQQKVDALSWLFHLFGDIHQPLHCIEHISQLHPDGDRGGNSFRLRGSPNNLHSLWDSSVNISENIGEDELANKIMQEHSRASLANDLQINDPEQWARTGFSLARTHAYSLRENPQTPPKPSSNYLKNMQQVGRRQAALAGYRLSDRLRELFG